MTNFRLSDEQIEYQSLARDFACRELSGRVHDCDKNGEVPRSVLDKAWQQGLVNVQLPEEFGGLGLNTVESCLIAEELGFGCSGIYGSIEGSTLAQLFLLRHGSRAMQERLLTPMTEKFELAAFSLNLLDAADDPTLLTVDVEKNGDSFLLSGEATVCNFASGKWLVTAAVERSSGLRFLVVVESLAGMSSGRPLNLLGRRATELSSVSLGSIKVPASNVLSFSSVQAWHDSVARAHCLIAAGVIGLARCGLENAIRYSKQRRTFGQAIGQHQAVGFMLADMAKDIQAARLLLLHAAELADSGRIDLVSAIVAHIFAQEAAVKVATDAVQVYGGYGYSREYPVEKLMRDAKVYQLYLLDSHRLKNTIGKSVLALV